MTATQLVVFDLETGGVEDHHPNIQIAAVALDAEWNERDTFEQKILFDELLADPEALELNSYDRDVWSGFGVPEHRAMALFCKWLDAHKSIDKVSARTGNSYRVARLCGHNASRFDFPRLHDACRSAGLFLPADFHVLDTLQACAWNFHRCREWPNSLKLTVVCQHFGIEVGDAHDALADCRMTAKLAKALLT